jgi:molybdopterin-guanine dinucleotide biosynthesis protein A
MVGNISGVILAGGANKRFNGITKANIDFMGKTLIARIIDAISPIFSEIIIVTNTPEEFEEYCEFKIFSDHFKNAGPLAGIHAALKGSSKEAVFVFAGDMPLIDSQLVSLQIEHFKDAKCDILIPMIKEYIEPLHAIYNSSVLNLLEDYLEGDNDYAVREFVKLAEVEYMILEDTDKNRNSFTNINSPEDLLRVKRVLGLI